VYGWYTSLIIGLLRRLIGFITTSVTPAHLITIIYQQYSAIADLRCGHTERYAMFAMYATYAVYAMFATSLGHTESYVWYETAQS
jgi:hypothetical protein